MNRRRLWSVPARPLAGTDAREQGLALLDVLLGMMVFALIVTIGLQSVSQFRQRAFQTGASSDAQQMSVGLESYFTDVGNYPAKADLVSFLDAYGVNLSRGSEVGGYARNNGEVQFCITHKTGGTAASNIDAWSIYDSRYGAVVSTGRGAASAPAFCTGGAATWDGFVEGTPGATPTTSAPPATTAPPAASTSPSPTPSTSPSATTPPPIDRAYAVAAGTGTTCGIKDSNKSLWCWGDNTFGAVGLNTTNDQYLTPTLVHAGGWLKVSHANAQGCGIQTDGSLWCWGTTRSGSGGAGTRRVPTRVGTATDWTDIKVGGDNFGDHHESFCGLRAGTNLYCWGWNHDGLTAQGTASDQYYPNPLAVSGSWRMVDVSARHACGIKTDGTAWCWGNNYNYVLGNGFSDSAVPLQVGSNSDWTYIDASAAFAQGATCGIRSPGTLWCWGSPWEHGGTGAGYKSNPTQVGSANNWIQVSAGSDWSCAIKSDSTLWCWGEGQEGALGRGNFDDASLPVQVGTATDWVTVTAGDRYACGLRSPGRTFCWGSNMYGQNGNGTPDGAQRTLFEVVF